MSHTLSSVVVRIGCINQIFKIIKPLWRRQWCRIPGAGLRLELILMSQEVWLAIQMPIFWNLPFLGLLGEKVINLWRCTTYERISPNFGINIEYEKIISVMLSQVIFYTFVTLKLKLSTKTKTTKKVSWVWPGTYVFHRLVLFLFYLPKKRKKSHF